MSANFLDALRGVAVVLSGEEDRLRVTTRDRLAALAERRRRAHRRWNLLQAMANAGSTEAALDRLLRELGLPGDEVLRDAARPLAEAVTAALAGDAAADPIEALDALEIWQHARHGGDLLTPHRTEDHFQPSVDF